MGGEKGEASGKIGPEGGCGWGCPTESPNPLEGARKPTGRRVLSVYIYIYIYICMYVCVCVCLCVCVCASVSACVLGVVVEFHMCG